MKVTDYRMSPKRYSERLSCGGFGSTPLAIERRKRDARILTIGPNLKMFLPRKSTHEDRLSDVSDYHQVC